MQCWRARFGVGRGHRPWPASFVIRIAGAVPLNFPS